MSGNHLRRHNLARLIIVVRLARLEHTSRSLIVMPGATIRKAREKSFDSFRAAFTACQAISMAMTVVLPLPVAIFIARRTVPDWPPRGIRDLIQEVLRGRTPGCDLSQPDDRLDGFELAEEGDAGRAHHS